MSGKSVWDLQGQPKVNRCKSHTKIGREHCILLKVGVNLNNYVNQRLIRVILAV